MAFTGKFVYIWFTISSFYGSIPLALGLIGRDSRLSTLCHSCGFACQQRVLKTFSGPGYLHSEDGVVWLWHSLVNSTMTLWQLMHLSTWVATKPSCAQVHELPQSHCGDDREGTLFSWLHINYAHLVSVRFKHSVCRGSLMTTIYICIYTWSVKRKTLSSKFMVVLFILVRFILTSILHIEHC